MEIAAHARLKTRFPSHQLPKPDISLLLEPSMLKKLSATKKHQSKNQSQLAETKDPKHVIQLPQLDPQA
jgi:hypothetical protein